MVKYIIKRLLQTVLLVVLISIVVFVMLRSIPGDPASLMLADSATATEADVDRLRHQWGLDRPLYVQYFYFASNAVKGDLGTSIGFSVPATTLVGSRLPATAQLAVAAVLLAMVISLPLGIIGGIKPGGLFDRLGEGLSILLQSIPAFWLGLMLILFFAVQLRWLPAFGGNTWKHLVLPSISLSTYFVPILTRLMRSTLLDVLSQDYLRTARAKGLSEHVVILRHALKNALIPVITVVGLQLGALLGGSVIIESVFGWPGVGRLSVHALYTRDYPVVQTVVLLMAVIFAFINLVVDISYAFLDPRIRYQ